MPCVRNAALGDFAGGHIFQSHSLVEDGEKVHIYFAALSGLHSDIFGEDPRREIYMHGGMGRATWERGRMWGVVPAVGGPHEGHVTARPIAGSAGKELCINAATFGDGEIAAELCTGNEWDIGPVVPISAKDGTGIDELREALAELLATLQTTTVGESIVLSERQRQAVRDASAAIRRAIDLTRDAVETIDCADLLAFELRAALNALGSVTGEVTTEDLLAQVFANFCIGK